ncbi:MAG TPA: malonyl-CoA synthase [Methylocella sp.]|nr:malonyl-CoA synthase [Methylocella sp.]
MNYLWDKLTQGLRGREDRVFLETAEGVSWTYADLDLYSARAAATLATLGVKAGDRVAVQVEKSPQALILYLATLRAGAVFLPLNPAYTSAEVAYFLADAEPVLLVCDPSRCSDLTPVARGAGVAVIKTLGPDGRGSFAERSAASGGSFQDATRGPEDLAAILYTSGTTGRSKGAMLTHANLASNAQTLAALWRFTHEDVLLHALPIYHVHGLFVAVHPVMLSGGKLLFLAKFDPGLCLSLMDRVTVLMGVPTFYTRLLQVETLTPDAVRTMRLFISGSAPLLEETHRQWRERTGHVILERYGMTETNMITSNPYQGERRVGTVGSPLPGVALRIADPESGAPLAMGEAGIIEVKGPNVFKGYWRNPEKTAEEFRKDGFFITGDLGFMDSNGYVHLIGRAKDLIISGGLNVYPKEVEAELDALPGVVESAVIGLPHTDFGEAVAAAVVLEEGVTGDEAALIAALAQKLAKFKLPKRVLFVEALPRNAMGKVQKNVLRELHRELLQPLG